MGRVGAAASEHGTERWWVGWGGNKGADTATSLCFAIWSLASVSEGTLA
jgi:hypothetical protein